ncbi:MAG TPA: hypothetical protein PK205_09100 [Promineifilum sp.]|nr:hypothetical protein [Promineifilum sp.]HRQ13451.1 hypothetical protein [Promineifilum sp.]
MGSSKRSHILFLASFIALIALLALWGGAGLVSGGTLGIGQTGPLIASSQSPLVQDFFAGDDAHFTITITNTGSIAFDSVVTSGSPVSGCNRNDLGGLNPGQSTSFDCDKTNVNESFMNEIQVTGTAGVTSVSHISKAFVKVLRPQLRITKAPPTQTVSRGGTAYFTIKVWNTWDEVLRVISVDDALVDACDLSPSPSLPVYIEVGDPFTFNCWLSNVQNPFVSIITVTATDPLEAEQYVASDAAWVNMLSLQAGLSAQPASVSEPGDPVTYTVSLTNDGNVPVTLNALTTDRFGNLLSPGNPLIASATNTCLPKPSLPTLPANGGSFQCSFVAHVEGQPSDFITTLTATGKDVDALETTATANASVTIIDVPASMTLTLGADPPFINPPSRQVTFSVRVENTSGADTITITEMTDQFVGNLDGRGTCDLPVTNLPPGFSYQCEFSAVVSGTIGQQKSRIVTVNAVDDDLPPGDLSVNGIVTVGITDQPTQYAYMPNVNEVTAKRTSCGRPFPLVNNQQYQFQPPNTYDSNLPVANRDQHYFVFELTQSSSVKVELTNFVPRKGQLIVRPHTEGGNPPCGDSIGRNTSEGLNKTVNLGNLAAGKYYIQLINDGPSDVGDFYGLIVRVQ